MQNEHKSLDNEKSCPDAGFCLNIASSVVISRDLNIFD